ncbi:Dps DNA-binding ferritin-like protein (oxidative damage protectant) [uncultured Caudovirales phage]|uniref:Dps DNA-binding ferritin-like protein (Oxidative damage protectant) n=1 Tax=uncultured Caudovirales phage TaxID=2100421 RepID=A0A6J7WU31_9CAUD|nr:Dps DNA-binding ferritin-like protein (oxidative damage protectant) [uncultured Caudovirales phage]
MNELLIEKLKAYHATNFAFYLKAHFFHWNVEGPNFPQYHEFLGELYEEVFGAVDDIAEHIRALQAYAPGSLSRFSALSIIPDQIDPVSSFEIFPILMADNTKIMWMIADLDKMANDAGEIGLSNFLQARHEQHRKHQWKLRSTAAASL